MRGLKLGTQVEWIYIFYVSIFTSLKVENFCREENQ